MSNFKTVIQRCNKTDMKNLQILRRSASYSTPLSEASSKLGIRDVISKGKDTHEYLKSGFTQVQDWYIKYGTMVSDKLYPEIFKYIDLPGARKLLEVGSGPGNGIRLIVPQVSSDCEIIASDINKPFLQIIEKQNYSNVRTLEANFEQLPLQDESIDRYISNVAIHNAKNTLAPFKEAFRVLNAGGILGVSVFGSQNNTYLQLNSMFRQYTDLPYHDSLVKSLQLMGTPDSLREIALKVGFKQAFAYSTYAYYPFTEPEEAMDMFLSFNPYQVWMEQFPERKEAFQQFVFDTLYHFLKVEKKLIGIEGVILAATKI